jgi:oxidase EvaA
MTAPGAAPRAEPAPVEPPSLLEFRRWRADIVAKSAFSIRPIPFASSREWSFVDGILRHRTGGFFALAGLAVAARTRELDGREQLVILQPETAINGFLLRRRRGRAELLFQGRVEPGNIEAMQLAPTVQSTEANYRRLHGGGPTAFLEWFTGERGGRILYDELQSEEGTRYYGKYNRNVVVEMPEAPDCELPAAFRWYDLEAIRAFAITSNVLNTDARSVLAGLDWMLLADPSGPFARHARGTFGALLRASLLAGADADDLPDGDLLAWLQRLRVRASVRHSVLTLPSLRNWVIEPDAIRERKREHGFCARQFAIHAAGREVASWDQPLIDSDGVGRLALIFQERDGVTRLLVKASHEIGFLEGVQCAPSLTISPGASPNLADPVEAELLELLSDSRRSVRMASCRQSEEGGRFERDENDYQVALLDPAVRIPESPFYRWLTLAQVRRLIQVPGTFSIEFRGVLALLLAYL